MQDPTSLSAVAEFHSTFKHPLVNEPSLPSDQRAALRQNLLEEELKELAQAIAEKDLVAIADAFCDLQYVLSGAILEFGMGTYFKALFDEVHRSNMSKACRTVVEAEATVNHYQRQGIDCYYEADSGNFLVYRREDGKTLKSINYSPANLENILQSR
nr:hypothetical protein [Cytophagales bacterium]